MKGRVICIDCDGTLTKDVCWTPDDCLNAVPREEVIEKVNEVGLVAFIVIYTARRDELIPATLKWLRKVGVTFHAISNNKIGTDMGYVDDKSITIEQFLNETSTPN